MGENMNLCPYFTTYTKINWRWSIDLKTSGKTVKHLEENIEKNLLNIG